MVDELEVDEVGLDELVVDEVKNRPSGCRRGARLPPADGPRHFQACAHMRVSRNMKTVRQKKQTFETKCTYTQ